MKGEPYSTLRWERETLHEQSDSTGPSILLVTFTYGALQLNWRLSAIRARMCGALKQHQSIEVVFFYYAASQHSGISPVTNSDVVEEVPILDLESLPYFCCVLNSIFYHLPLSSEFQIDLLFIILSFDVRYVDCD